MFGLTLPLKTRLLDCDNTRGYRTYYLFTSSKGNLQGSKVRMELDTVKGV